MSRPPKQNFGYNIAGSGGIVVSCCETILCLFQAAWKEWGSPNFKSYSQYCQSDKNNGYFKSDLRPLKPLFGSKYHQIAHHFI